MAWVYRHSPASGAAFAVHVALADAANDLHDYELWMRQHRLAAKARVSVRSVTDALAWLVEHDLLQLVSSGKTNGTANRYRLLMPDRPVVYEPKEGTQPLRTPYAATADPGTQPLLTGYAATADITQGEPKHLTQEEHSRAALAAGFDRWYDAYPRKVAKGQARKAWPAAVKKAGGVERLIEAARRYAARPDLDPKFIPHPATWLNGERWEDHHPPLPNRAKVAGVDDDRDAPAGRLDL